VGRTWDEEAQRVVIGGGERRKRKRKINRGIYRWRLRIITPIRWRRVEGKSFKEETERVQGNEKGACW